MRAHAGIWAAYTHIGRRICALQDRKEAYAVTVYYTLDGF